MLGAVKLQLLLRDSRFMSQSSHLYLQRTNPDCRLHAQFFLVPLDVAEVVLQLMVSLQLVAVVSENLYKFPHNSVEIPSFVVNEGGCGLGAGLYLRDQLLLLCIRGCPLGVSCLQVINRAFEFDYLISQGLVGCSQSLQLLLHR